MIRLLVVELPAKKAGTLNFTFGLANKNRFAPVSFYTVKINRS